MNKTEKLSSSLVFKITSWHFFRRLFTFLWMDILITALTAGAALYYAETQLSRRLEAGDVPTAGSVWSGSAGGEELGSFAPLRLLLPENTRDARRGFFLSAGMDAMERLRTLEYVLILPGGDRMAYPLGEVAVLYVRCFAALLILQAVSLLTGIRKSSRAVRRALSPIETLTQTAMSLNSSPQSAAQLHDLTGAIDSIDAMALDKRVSVSASQSELKNLAGAINSLLDRVDQAYRSQVRFVSDASHELRTPIAVIQGYANLLDRWGKNDPKALEESIAAIKGEAQSMKDLVEQLLFLARGDNDSMAVSMERFPLSALMEEVIRETVMIDPGHSLTSRVDPDLDMVGDAQLIKQAVRIFIDNSIKYTPGGEEIRIGASREGDAVKIVIQDNGIGIVPEALPHVFDRFFRADDSRARKTGGTGLGLAIAKWIVDRHGGTVEILSRKDIGTRVTLTFSGAPAAG